ncbi:MAG: T9SS type A sorting domain-containing protein [Saprospiraceae bacterium]|nr:T9SS type A sorting domain-containing protein [Saprospiraceae bacterium]
MREWQHANPTANFTKNINISEFAAGIYFLQIQTETGVDVVRLVKR